jgi:phosphoglycolate phosphatase-like HAD superfamily hydrolase
VPLGQFEALLKKMNCKSADAVVVGDTINDILAARQLGNIEIAVRSPYGNSIQVQRLKPHFFLEDINELGDVLKVLNLRGK